MSCNISQGKTDNRGTIHLKTYSDVAEMMSKTHQSIRKACDSEHYLNHKEQLVKCTKLGSDPTSTILKELQAELDILCDQLDFIDLQNQLSKDVLENYLSLLKKQSTRIGSVFYKITLQNQSAKRHRCRCNITLIHIELVRVLQGYFDELSDMTEVNKLIGRLTNKSESIHQRDWAVMLWRYINLGQI